MATAVSERPLPTGEGLTFEKVWAMFQESDRRMQEADERRKQEMQESERIRQEVDNRRKQEADERQRKLDRQMRNLNRQMGGLHRRFGEMAEHLVAPGIARRFNELGFHFDAIAAGGYKVLDEQLKTKAEVDILLENDNCIIAVEVKATVNTKDIEHHIKRLEILKEYRSKKKDSRIIYGAIAGAIFGPAEKKLTIEAGFYVLQQSGDTMKMEIPDDFTPQEW